MKRKSRRAQTSAHPHRVAAERRPLRARPRAGRRRTVTLEAWRSAPRTAEEFPAFLRTTESAFHEDVTDDELARWRTVFEPERSLAVLERLGDGRDGRHLHARADDPRRAHERRRASPRSASCRRTAAAACSPPHAPPARRRPRRGRVRRGAVGVRGARSTGASATALPARHATSPRCRTDRRAAAPRPPGARRAHVLLDLAEAVPRSPRSTTASAASAPATSTARARGGTAASRTRSTPRRPRRAARRGPRGRPTGPSTAMCSTP